MSYVETDTGPMVLIGDHNYQEFLSPVVDGEQRRTGLIPRPMETHPPGCYPWAQAVTVPMVAPADYAAWIARKDAEKSWITDIRLTAGPGGGIVPSRDQDGRGYCWRHSPTTAQMAFRAVMGQPYADLSAYAGACRIKNYRDEGGWGAQGVDDVVTFGDPTSEFWPQQATDRKYDTPEMRANALLHRFIDQWADLAQAQYDRNLSWDQFVSLNLQDTPTVDDYNWWSHSVCGVRVLNGASHRHRTRMGSGKLAALHEFDLVWAMNHPITGGLARAIWNSWGDTWSDKGIGALTGSKAIPDGGVAPRLVRPAA